MKKLISFGIVALALPVLAFGQQLGNVESLAQSIGRIVNVLIPIVFALAMLFFFWGLAMYIFGGEHKADQAKKTMIWGVVAIFVMAAVWGLVAFLGDALGIDTGGQAGFRVGDLVPRP